MLWHSGQCCIAIPIVVFLDTCCHWKPLRGAIHAAEYSPQHCPPASGNINIDGSIVYFYICILVMYHLGLKSVSVAMPSSSMHHKRPYH